MISNEKVTFGHFLIFFSFSLKMYFFINIFGEFRFLNFWNIYGKRINRLQSIEMQLCSIQIPTKYFKMTYFALEMTLYNTKWPFFNRFLIKITIFGDISFWFSTKWAKISNRKFRIELIFGQIMEFLLMSVSSFEIDRSSWQIIVTNNFCSSKDSWVILTWKIMIDREQTSKL